jgi:hypothetical protein
LIRSTLSGWDWDYETRRRVCSLLLQLKDVTRAEAAWLVKAGVRRGAFRALQPETASDDTDTHESIHKYQQQGRDHCHHCPS